MPSNVAGTAELKLYKRRWFMLALFIMYTFNGAQEWAEFTIINNLVSKYYDVSTIQVEWTSIIFTLSYVLLIIPSLYVIPSMGIRHTMVLGSLGVTLGNWIKVFSVAPNRFHLVLLGQSCSAFFQMLTFGLVGRFTAVWFGVDEIAVAGVLALFGSQVGVTFAFFFPSTMVQDGPNEVIGNGLRNMHLIIATISTSISILILLCKSKPKSPPSLSQIKQTEVKHGKILKTFFTLLKNPPFVLFLFSYGLNCATCSATTTCLNELIVGNFPDGISDAGNIGSLLMISGMMSSLVTGKVLDKTRRFKESAILLTSGSAISMILFTFSLKSSNIMYVYLAGFCLGAFVMAYYSIGMQLAIELTYPVKEEISTSLTFFSCQAFSFILTVVYGIMINTFGDLKTNIGISTINVIACVIIIWVPVDLKRQRAENEPKMDELMEFV